jgi:hypothetical protein
MYRWGSAQKTGMGLEGLELCVSKSERWTELVAAELLRLPPGSSQVQMPGGARALGFSS